MYTTGEISFFSSAHSTRQVTDKSKVILMISWFTYYNASMPTTLTLLMSRRKPKIEGAP
jgi:hypothetical protein